MANCQVFLDAVVETEQTDTLQQLFHDTLASVTFGRNDCKSFLVKFTAFTVVDFVVNLASSPSISFSYDVKMYRVVDKVMTEIAMTTSTDQTAMFSKEFTAGNYLVCFQTNSMTTLSGTVLPVFRGYQRYAVMSAYLAEGAGASFQFDARRPPVDCSAELYFELLEGSLPPGIRMNHAGKVLGIAPNLDCIEDTAHLPPAQNWSYVHNDESYHPWGKQWRFKVRVSIAEIREVFADEWFCVKIHNNWSLDRDNFLLQAPFQQEFHDELVQQVVIPNLCPPQLVEAWAPRPILLQCPDGSPAKFEVTQIPTTGCASCDGQEVSESIPMPFGVPSIGTAGFEGWLVDAESSQCPEVVAFIARFKDSPIYQQYLIDEPIEVVQDGRDVVLRTYVNDPNAMFSKWRAEQNQRLPWTVDVMGSENLVIALTVYPRGGF